MSKKEKRHSVKKRKSCNIDSLFTEIDNAEIDLPSAFSETPNCDEISETQTSSSEDVFRKEILDKLKELLIRVNQIEVHLAGIIAFNKVEKRAQNDEGTSARRLDDIELPARSKETLDKIEAKLADVKFQDQMVSLKYNPNQCHISIIL